MSITQVIYKKGEKPLPLTDEEMAEIEALKSLPDSEIDYSDDLLIKTQVLDTDIVEWLINEDTSTKQHINEILRHFMLMKVT